MRISDWSSDVCSSDLRLAQTLFRVAAFLGPFRSKRVGGFDILREVAFLPFEPLDRHGADAIALGDDVDRAQIPALDTVGGARKSVVEGTGVSVRVGLGGRRILHKKRTLNIVRY